MHSIWYTLKAYILAPGFAILKKNYCCKFLMKKAGFSLNVNIFGIEIKRLYSKNVFFKGFPSFSEKYCGVPCCV